MNRLTLLGVGAMNSPRFRPAGLLVEVAGRAVLLDGGGSPGLPEHIEAWLVCDERAELMPQIRRLARTYGVVPGVAAWSAGGVTVRPLPAVHTSHPTYGYLLSSPDVRVAWAPEFWQYPDWAADLDILFADAAGWRRPIRFRGGVGGHACALDVVREAQDRGVRRLVFAHIGRPTIAAVDAGEHLGYGEFGRDGQTFEIGVSGTGE